MPARARLSGLALVMSLPSNRIRPDFGRKRPITLLSNVLLPTPLRPIKQTTSPGPTARSTSRTISVSPYATDSFSIASIKNQEPNPKNQEPNSKNQEQKPWHGVLGIWFSGFGSRDLVLGIWFFLLDCHDLPVLSKVHLDHFRIFLDFFYSTFAEDPAFVKDGYPLGNLTNESHVVLDDKQGVLAGHGHEELAGLFRLTRGHAGDRLVDQEQLGVLEHDHAELEPLFFAVSQQAGDVVGFVA